MEGTLRIWILELAKDTIAEEMEEVKKMREQGHDHGVERGKEHIIRKLKRIHGGGYGRDQGDEERRGGHQDGHARDDQHHAEALGQGF